MIFLTFFNFLRFFLLFLCSDAAQNPLTFQEKKSLITKIHKLPASKMQQVVDIIKDAIPPEKRGEGDEIEIPLDELDTFTLRKLQSFVEVRNTIQTELFK